MPTYDEIDTYGMQIETTQWAGSVLRASYGGGYGDIALVDNAAGLHLWTMRRGNMPAEAGVLEVGGTTRFDYYWDFFKDHTTGATEIFIIAYRGKKYHASFVDPSMDATKLSFKLFAPEWYSSGGVKIKQRRVQGFSYDVDGSIPPPDLTNPEAPTDVVATPISSSSVLLSWDAAIDPDPSSDDTPPSVPTGLAMRSRTTSSITIEWDASTD